ncbi:hypothetical protein AKG09_01720 [Neisseria sp. 83E34]|nr:hypothetical protein AKG09_01720 [Neisseria sp. 83E34]
MINTRNVYMFTASDGKTNTFFYYGCENNVHNNQLTTDNTNITRRRADTKRKLQIHILKPV